MPHRRSIWADYSEVVLEKRLVVKTARRVWTCSPRQRLKLVTAAGRLTEESLDESLPWWNVTEKLIPSYLCREPRAPSGIRLKVQVLQSRTVSYMLIDIHFIRMRRLSTIVDRRANLVLHSASRRLLVQVLGVWFSMLDHVHLLVLADLNDYL